MPRHFTSETLDFLQDLEVHNERAWFKANQDRYEHDVRGRMLRFVEDAADPLHERISAHLVADARKVGGSLFRINRDVRFSNDKSPYKTNSGAFFRHERGKDVVAPGVYLHLEPGNCFMGAGVYMPPTDVLKTLRTAIVTDPDGWVEVRDEVTAGAWAFGGDSLTRAPKGFDVDHPLIEDLRRKSFILSRPLTENQVTGTRFLDLFIERAEQTKPLLAWICTASGLDF